MQKIRFSPLMLYFIAIMSSLSSAGASMTLLALSTSFFNEYPDGFASSGIQLIYYLGIGCVGLLGGVILQRWSAITLGIFGPLLSACIVFYLASLDGIPLFLGFPSIFLIFLLNGIDHPNNLRFFNEVVSTSQKISFFSFTESITAVFQLISPLLAGAIIVGFSIKACFIIDGCTYLISAIPWLIIKRKIKVQEAISELPLSKISFFVGFRVLYEHAEVRSLTISRLLNNLAYVTCTTAIPLVIAIMVNRNQDFFTYQLAVTNALISTGFIGAGLIGARISRNNNNIISLVYLSSILGFTSCLLLISSLTLLPLLYLSTFLLGIGTYCFRISGMTLGQAFTPSTILGPVIIAGDTVVRSWSFLVSSCTLFVFELHTMLGMSSMTLFLLANFLPCGTILAPKWSLKLARRHKDNQAPVSL
jgi:Major Facilitator Superfamily